LAGVAATTLVASTVTADATTGAADRHHPPPAPTRTVNLPKQAVMTGSGGAVASVDRDASQVGINMLAAGGNAADAAVATAAALGVTEPYSTGIGGGGYLVYYNARTHQVSTIDGRETAPASFTSTTFTKADGSAMDFATVVNSGLSIGVPGTPALWDRAARTLGTKRLSSLLKPAETLARKGFIVDQTFHDQTVQNATRFAKFPATAALFLPGGAPPAVGARFTNPQLADSYQLLRDQGVNALYRGKLGSELVAEADHPHTAAGVIVAGGQLSDADLAGYRAQTKAPIVSSYDGLRINGMPQSSSGGITVAETLNLLQAYVKKTHVSLSALSDAQYLHYFSEATATAFADRNRYIGDVPGVPVGQLTSKAFADQRACGFDPSRAQPRPIPFGNPAATGTSCAATNAGQNEPYEGTSTSHLVAADKWGDVASYTLTIEQTGGSAITLPGRGFLLNNELTDFSFVPVTSGVPDPNLPGPHKRPRSSMSPTIVLSHGRPYLALGSPGGASIITTVSQVLTEFLDRGLCLEDAIAAPRLSSGNGKEQAEPALLNSTDGAALQAQGHVLVLPPAPQQVGAAVAIRILGHDQFLAATEPVRRGGGSAMVVRPR
jgi:gamma-glutamyltranspeptidase/glutathione hydrolase